MEWKQDAACLGVDSDVFLNEEPEAKEICARCKVLTPCLVFALEGDEYGVWGGTTRAERKKIRKLKKAS